MSQIIVDPSRLLLLIDSFNVLTTTQVEEMLECFPFQPMANINILDNELLRLHILFLQKLIMHDLFYKNLNAFQEVLNFIMNSLWSLKDVNSSELLSCFLGMLKIIILKSKDMELFKNFFQNRKRKFYQRISICAKYNCFNTNHVSDFTMIICEILKFDGDWDDEYSTNFENILSAFSELKVFREIILISEIVIERFPVSSEVFKLFSLWILENGNNILVKNDSEFLLMKLLKVLNCFYEKYEYIKNSQEYNITDITKGVKYNLDVLYENSAMLATFFDQPNLRENSIKLFAYLLASQNTEISWDFFNKELTHLQKDPTKWIQVDPELFLRICYLLCKSNRIIWHPNKILQIISSLIYSYKRYSIKTDFLKIICYLYPILMAESISKPNAVLGDYLLIIMSQHYYEIENVYSLHLSQLNWILRRGKYILKKSFICFWLNHDGDLDTIKKCILRCNVQNILLEIILDVHLKPTIAVKVAELIRHLQHPHLNAEVAQMLPCVFHIPNIFNALMLSDPGIPEDISQAKLLTEFMSLILVNIINEKIFALACDYSKKLLSHLKSDKDIVNLFCKNYENILFLLKRLKKLEDESVMKMMGLIKILLLIQKRNHLIADKVIEIDIDYVLSGSTIKLDKCLDVLQILITKNFIIAINPRTVQATFLRLFSIYEVPYLSKKSLLCLTEILKNNHWLASSSSTNFFIETQCSLVVKEDSWHEFVVFLTTWIKILKKSLPLEYRFYLAHTGIIGNFIMRLPNLSQKKVHFLIKSLNKLDLIYPPDNFK